MKQAMRRIKRKEKLPVQIFNPVPIPDPIDFAIGNLSGWEESGNP